MIWLSKEQLIFLHRQLIDETGGSHGLRDEGLLEASLTAPFQTYDSIELFPTLISKITRLAWGITKNHPFIDGNKRIGAHAMLLALKLNEISITYTQRELIDIFNGIASGFVGFKQLYNWIKSHITGEEC